MRKATVHLHTAETHCFWSRCSETIIICHPTLKSSHPKWHSSERMPNEDKSSFFRERPAVWKELRPCVGECVKGAWRWRGDDTGLRAEKRRVVVRGMNSDWRSAQWQLNDLRSVDSVSINQTALSHSRPFFLFLPLALISAFVSKPWAWRGRFVLSLCLSLLFSLPLSLRRLYFLTIHFLLLFLSFTCSLTAPSAGQFSFCALSLH